MNRFRGFGPLRYARITMDPGSGRSRGTGFACFWNKADADKVVEQSDLLRAETTGSAELVSTLFIDFDFRADRLWLVATEEKPFHFALYPYSGPLIDTCAEFSLTRSHT